MSNSGGGREFHGDASGELDSTGTARRSMVDASKPLIGPGVSVSSLSSLWSSLLAASCLTAVVGDTGESKVAIVVEMW